MYFKLKKPYFFDFKLSYSTEIVQILKRKTVKACLLAIYDFSKYLGWESNPHNLAITGF
jgi:hypothetical protein